MAKKKPPAIKDRAVKTSFKLEIDRIEPSFVPIADR